MEEMKKKIGFLSCMFMCIGGTIGVSIFGTLPEEARKIGPGVVCALAAAALITVFRYFSRMYTCAALPISASTIMHGTKLIHPLVGGFLSINALLQPVMVSLFGIMFATYFAELFPQLEISKTVVSTGLLVVFAGITYFGSRASAKISNIIVVSLLLVIGSYIVLGWPRIDPQNVSFMRIIKPGVGLTSIGASVGVLSSSLSGASTAAEIADEIKNPAKNVPLVLIFCPIIVAAIYILLAVVTIGVIPYSEVMTLAQVAESFMSPTLVTLFIVGGPVCGVLTALVSVALTCITQISYAAKLGVLPAVFCRQNRHGVSTASLLVVFGVAICICLSGATFGVVITVQSFSNMLAEIPNTIAPIFAHKKYPGLCNRSFIRINHKIISATAVLTAMICLYLSVEMAASLSADTVAVLFAAYGIGFAYLFFRARFLKKRKNIDLFADLGRPYEKWEEQEKACLYGREPLAQ